MWLRLKSLHCVSTASDERTEEPSIYIANPATETRQRLGPYHMRDNDTRYFDLDPMEIPRAGMLQIGFLEQDSALSRHGWDEPAFVDIPGNHPVGSFRTIFPLRHGGMSGGTHIQEYHLYYDVVENQSDIPEQRYLLQLVSLKCNDAQEAKDEIVLKVNGDHVWGAWDVKTGETFDLSSRTPLVINRLATIELWESDAHSRNNLLERFNLVVTDDFHFGEELPKVFSWRSTPTIDAKYTLRYIVTVR